MLVNSSLSGKANLYVYSKKRENIVLKSKVQESTSASDTQKACLSLKRCTSTSKIINL